MYCTKCGTRLIDGECPMCVDSSLIKKDVNIGLVNNNRNLETLALVFSIISVIISIIPFHFIVIILGYIIALVASGIALKLRLKYRSRKIDFAIILSVVAVISLTVWVFFLNFILHKL